MSSGSASTDNFFELGGHSLLATQVISSCAERLPGGTAGCVLCFESTATVAGSGRKHRSIAAKTVSALTRLPSAPVSREGVLPLSFGQQRLWFLDQLVPGSPFYNVPAAVRLRGQLDVSGARTNAQ